jgi:hypothetical protein
MAPPNSHKAGERLTKKIYEVRRRRLLAKIGITEKELDKVFEEAIPAIKKDLNALVRYSDRDVERVLRKHLGGRIAERREVIVEKMIEEGASDGRIDQEVFKAIFGEGSAEESPLERQSDLARRGQRFGLHLIVSGDEPQ